MCYNLYGDNMDNIVLKRVGAYFIDSFIVTFISFLIIQIPFINPYSDKYEDAYEKMTKLEENYEEKKMSDKEYLNEIKGLNYEVNKYNFPYTLVTTATLFGYFILFQYYNKGQTFGKKILKIKLKGIKNKKLKFKNYLIRGLILESIIINILLMLCLIISNKDIYYYLTLGISIIESAFLYSIIVTMLFRKDNRGLHDILASTKVVSVKEENLIEA